MPLGDHDGFTGKVLSQGLRAEVAAEEFIRQHPDWEYDENGFLDEAHEAAYNRAVHEAVESAWMRPTSGHCIHCSAFVEVDKTGRLASKEPGAPTLYYCGGIEEPGNEHSLAHD